MPPTVRLLCLALGLAAGTGIAGPAARADVAMDPIGQVAEVPAEAGPHRVWLTDMVARRSALIDADTGKFLGTIYAGSGILAPLASPDRREIYVAETYRSRGSRGERTDVVTIYDARSLRPTGEIPIPPKRADHASGVAASALSDDGRFVAVWNQTPATSLTIVDVAERRVAGEIATPGCSLVYSAGPRRFLMLCADGAALSVSIDDAGRERAKLRSAPFFDPETDPVMEKAARWGDTWVFVSFDGVAHPVDVSGEALGFPAPWPLLGDADRRDGWRIGGVQQLAVHGPSGRLFALAHQGGPDTHKQPGTEVFVYDLAQRRRVARIALWNPVAGFLRRALALDAEGFGGRIAAWLLERLVPNPGADRIFVTQDDRPVLLASTTFPATLGVHDANSGAFLRDVSEVGIAGGLLVAP